jgi:ATP-dependent protease HslVU (ClpYQ) peptidase subunit
MTCIVGFLDKKNDCVWIGGDSLGSNSYTKATQSPSKVFRHDIFKNVIMGGTTTFRHLDLLKYSENIFDKIDFYENAVLDHKYMVTKFVPKVIDLFKTGIISEYEKDRGGNFIVGANNRLFEIQDDYAVLEPTDGICAVGCGEDVAMGSLLTTLDMDMTPLNKVQVALQAAEKRCCGVQRPFHIINTKDETVITIE